MYRKLRLQGKNKFDFGFDEDVIINERPLIDKL